jgi:hypothetical protein
MPPVRPTLRLVTLVLAVGAAASASARAQESAAPEPRVIVPTARTMDPNAAVLAAIRAMPSGGQYATSRPAFDGLCRAITVDAEGLRLEPFAAQPSFCSGATYLVFLRALDRLSRSGAFALDRETLNALAVVPGQRDGVGIWGRWNANGPGTARLFTELRLGRNFTEIAHARPGDFLKIFWTDEIGQRERGHSVVYLGRHVIGGIEHVRFWSSNQASAPGDLSGYGEKIVPSTKIARMIFSRLQNPANIARSRAVTGTDTFLASLLSRRISMDEVRRMCDL